MNISKCCFGYLTVNNILTHPARCFYKTTRKETVNTANQKMKSQCTKKPVEQKFDSFLILDFEATCEPGFNKIKVQEIIEFPCLWVDSKDFKVIGKFHRYVKPMYNPERYCVSLTGITDLMLKDEEFFPFVLEDFKDWYKSMKKSTGSKNEIFVTSGSWDLQTMLPNQCKLFHLEVPANMIKFIDIKVVFSSVTGVYPKNIKDMLTYLNIKEIGKMHRGLDDCKNIYSVFRRFGMNGFCYS